jgi:hypothetical protein
MCHAAALNSKNTLLTHKEACVLASESQGVRTPVDPTACGTRLELLALKKISPLRNWMGLVYFCILTPLPQPQPSSPSPSHPSQSLTVCQPISPWCGGCGPPPPDPKPSPTPNTVGQPSIYKCSGYFFFWASFIQIHFLNIFESFYLLK